MKLLAICIPNYNRIDKLERLVRESAVQITKARLTGLVQICISDDCSAENPDSVVSMLREENPQVEILYERGSKNRGMDYNFLHSVMMADSEYCWIIGNDDLPAEGGIRRAVDILQTEKQADILVTPFDAYGEDGKVRQTVHPLQTDGKRLFDTSGREQLAELVFSVGHNSGLFGFLSNVVFRRQGWAARRERFRDKMDTIFIQMYMNIQTLLDGAVYLYMPEKIIRNYADDETNGSLDRVCRILYGLDGVVEYFFEGEERKHLKRVIVDAYVSGTVWDMPDSMPYKKKLRDLDSPKNRIYRKYFIPSAQRERVFKGAPVMIYGAGNYGQKALAELKTYGACILGVADTDRRKRGLNLGGFAVMSVEEMVEVCRTENVSVVIANYAHVVEMADTLFRNGVERIRIIS